MIDQILSRFVDIMLSIPAILLAIITVAVLGPGFLNLVLVLGFNLLGDGLRDVLDPRQRV